MRQRKPFTSTNPVAEPRQATVPASPVVNGSPYPAQYWPWMMPGQQTQFGATPEAANDWMRQQQQMYATMNTMMSQWYGQYMQAAYGGGMGGFYPASPMQQPNAFGHVVQHQQQTEPVAQQQEVPRAQAPPQQAMNAQGGLAPADMDEDDRRNRDWLDYVYMACRASLLLMILYFYSSIERFIFVILCCTVMYGLQAGWFGRRGQQQQPEQQPQRGPVPGAAQGPLPNRPHDQPAAEGVGAEPEDQADRQQPQRQDAAVPPPSQDIQMTAWNVFWSTCWTFISSFFASLVPERPPPLNI